jgi:hypothetical protein
MVSDQYNRQKMLETGTQIDISDIVKKGGLLIPAYATKKLWDTVLKLDMINNELNTEETNRINEVVSKLIYYIRTHRQTSKSNLINFSVSFTREGNKENFDIVSNLIVIDKDNPNPCITLMLADEQA